ncbi:MAG: hypothetical protein Q9208_002424 [Pyrenodesmia sp. 3 TL-2023]
MAASNRMAAAAEPPKFVLLGVPVAHQNFVSYVNHKDAHEVAKLVAPFNDFEARLREGFAQHRDHPSLQDPNVNAVPIFDQGQDVPRISKRKIDVETHHQDHIIPLSAKDRKPAGAPATVESIQDFKKNFNLFSESSLVDLDWSNVVAAGSSVVTPLLPVPENYNTSKKAQREYYHQRLAPSSDVDLFIWGLDEAAAIEKIKQIEASIRNAILEEVTNAITIASHYPIRHVQIVLRLYQSVSEIISGFDVDCSCFAYDGNQVYGTPRGITAFMTQTNTIDLTRRSPSYESRLSKYAHRGFEIYWPDLDRSKVDPTIFERSFARTVGLAKLLVLEQLPKPGDREDYLRQRRLERGRPAADTYYRSRRSLPDNKKEQDPDDIPEWAYDDEVSNYHSFTVPYGPKYHAKKIEKLLYTKDLLLNAEWNKNKDRTVNLHRHPCFIGPLECVILDCCGYCPQPKTDEEFEVAEEEGKIYVSGDVEFKKDDPGRQAIGSFNPLTDDDWTDMAYIGNTQELCQKICDGDANFVEEWCQKNPNDVDRRDHTGRTPLHLAAQCSTPDVLYCLVENNARVVARLVDGMTALHIAAARGNVDMVTTLLERSEENEEDEAEKEDRRKAERKASSRSAEKSANDKEIMEVDQDEEDDDSDEDMDDVSSESDTSMTDGSFVKVSDHKGSDEDALENDNDGEPDVYDVNVLAWDAPVSPLHLAILGGHSEVVKTLISTFGADALLPIKVVDQYSRNPQHAIMTLVLAARLSCPAAAQVTHELLAHGASSAQADIYRVSAFHYLTAKKKIDLLKICVEEDGAAVAGALNHLIVEDSYLRAQVASPLITAIKSGDVDLVNYLLDVGAKPAIDLDSFASAYSAGKRERSSYGWDDIDTSKMWREEVIQPIRLAVEMNMPEVVPKLLEMGADINTIDKEGQRNIAISKGNGLAFGLRGKSILDAVVAKISALEEAIGGKDDLPRPPVLQPDSFYLKNTEPGSYAHWYLSKSIETAKNMVRAWKECKTRKDKEEEERVGKQQRLSALEALKARFINLRHQLEKRGAKTMEKLHPGIVERLREYRKEKFQAAWEGHTGRIKELTLGNWGPDKRNRPLQVAVQDGKGFTPFTIATYKHHFETAKLILGIANVQFKEPEKSNNQRRYELAGISDHVNYHSNGASLEEDDSESLDISSRGVDEIYTYDNVAELQDSVGSKVSGKPLSHIMETARRRADRESGNLSVIEMLSNFAEVWWFLNKPEKEARDEVGVAQMDVRGALRSGGITSHVARKLLSSDGYEKCRIDRYAVASRDIALLRFWIQCCRDALKMKQKDDSVTSIFDMADFQFAVKRGYVEEIAEMIKLSGTQLPLDALIKKTGIEEPKKAGCYQGLSIGGKRMTGWARERGGKSYRSAVCESTPPLLQAAHAGSLAAVEWFLSDTPLRLYKGYKEKNTDDTRLKRLAEAPGGFKSVVGQWLKQRSESSRIQVSRGEVNSRCLGHLALHGAVLSDADHSQSFEVINYLIAVMPDSVDLPSFGDQLTPLALAFVKGRVDVAKELIEAGADQTTRDASGKNLVHLALINASKSEKVDSNKFKELLGLIDRRVIGSLLTERCRDGPGGLTPLALWFTKGSHTRYYQRCELCSNDGPAVVAFLLESGGKEATRMMDSSGQFPLHSAVKASHAAMVKVMLEHDPALLCQENAMGQTPLELAHSMYIRCCTEGNPDIRIDEYKLLGRRDPEHFNELSVQDDSVKESDKESDEEWDNSMTRTWKLCKRFADQEPRSRKLVSVNEAREVAKRLAETGRKWEIEYEAAREKDAGGQETVSDEVSGWLGYGWGQ